MTRPILIIDVGHGGKDAGASYGDYLEKDFNLEISLYQYYRFMDLGIDALINRTDDVYLSPDDRVEMINRSEAKICISNHVNAGGGEGAETIHSIYTDGKLAHKILYALQDAGQKIRRVFTRANSRGSDYYYIIRRTEAQTIIIEYAFIDHDEDRERLKDNLEHYAEAVIKALCSHLDLKYTPPKIEDKDIKEDWKLNGIKYLHENELLQDIEGWTKKIDGDAPVWMVGILLKNVHKDLRDHLIKKMKEGEDV